MRVRFVSAVTILVTAFVVIACIVVSVPITSSILRFAADGVQRSLDFAKLGTNDVMDEALYMQRSFAGVVNTSLGVLEGQLVEAVSARSVDTLRTVRSAIFNNLFSFPQRLSQITISRYNLESFKALALPNSTVYSFPVPPTFASASEFLDFFASESVAAYRLAPDLIAIVCLEGHLLAPYRYTLPTGETIWNQLPSLKLCATFDDRWGAITGSNPELAPSVITVSRQNLPDFLLFLGGVGATAARNITKAKYRLVPRPGPGRPPAFHVEPYNDTHSALFAIDDPEIPTIVTSTMVNRTSGRLVLGLDCEDLVAGATGVCWERSEGKHGNVNALDVDAADPLAVARQDRAVSILEVEPYVLLSYLLSPLRHVVYSADNVQLARFTYHLTTESMKPYLADAVLRTGYPSGEAFLFTSAGTLLSASTGANLGGRSTLWRSKLSISEACADKSVMILVASAWMILQWGEYDAVPLESMHCIPSDFVGAVVQWNRAEATTTPGSFKNILSPENLQQFRSLQSIQCHNDRIESNDTLLFVSEMHHRNTDLTNSSRKVIHNNETYWSSQGAPFRSNLFVGLLALRSEMLGAAVTAIDRSQQAFGAVLKNLTDLRNSSIRTLETRETIERDALQTREQSERNQLIWVLLLVTSVFASICAFAGSVSVRPLRHVLVALEKIERFDLENAVTILETMPLYFQEFALLQKGITLMSGHLVEYRRFLPQWVLDGDSGSPRGEISPRSSSGRGKINPSPTSERADTFGKTKLTKSNNSSPNDVRSARGSELQAPTFTRNPDLVAGSVLISKDIGVMVILLDLRQTSCDSVTQLVNEFVIAAEPVINQHRGSLAPDHVTVMLGTISFVITFNAQLTRRQYGSSAADCAHELRERLGDKKNLFHRMSIGVDCGNVNAGSIGSNTQRWFLACGAPVMRARVLAAYGKYCGATIMVSGRILEKCSVERVSFDKAEMDTLQYDFGNASAPYRVQPHGPASNDMESLSEPAKLSRGVLRSFCLGLRTEQDCDEWMYMLEQAEKALAGDVLGPICEKVTDALRCNAAPDSGVLESVADLRASLEDAARETEIQELMPPESLQYCMPAVDRLKYCLDRLVNDPKSSPLVAVDFGVLHDPFASGS